MAKKRLAEIRAEIESILTEFPELRRQVAYRRRIFQQVDRHQNSRRHLRSSIEERR